MLSRLPLLARALALGGLAAAALLSAAPAQAQHTGEEPLARFEDPICPGVVGLRVDAAEQVVGRIRGNVSQLGLRLAPEGDCKPNLIVALLRDGGEFLAELKRENAWLFAELGREESEALMAESGPVRALLRVRARSRDGMPIPRRENMVDLPQTEMWMAHSKIYTATRNDILSALILFDREAMGGISLAQLADYATFRALSRTLPDVPEQRRDSILALFEGGAVKPAGLTDFDRAYLAGLYEGLPNLPAPARIARIEAVTGRDLFVE